MRSCVCAIANECCYPLFWFQYRFLFLTITFFFVVFLCCAGPFNSTMYLLNFFSLLLLIFFSIPFFIANVYVHIATMFSYNDIGECFYMRCCTSSNGKKWKNDDDYFTFAFSNIHILLFLCCVSKFKIKNKHNKRHSLSFMRGAQSHSPGAQKYDFFLLILFINVVTSRFWP